MLVVVFSSRSFIMRCQVELSVSLIIPLGPEILLGLSPQCHEYLLHVKNHLRLSEGQSILSRYRKQMSPSWLEIAESLRNCFGERVDVSSLLKRLLKSLRGGEEKKLESAKTFEAIS